MIDCIYMTVISLTSVGYGEIIKVSGNLPAQIFTMILITFGMGIILYSISTLTAMIIEGELTGIIRKDKMKKKIKKLKNHFIVCGGGETGYQILVELFNNHESAVLIELNEEMIERCRSLEKLLYIQGDATDDKNLIAAGIDKATGIIIVLPSDKDTLYVTMTARMLNKDIRIISKITKPDIEPKLKTAGADSVVSPNNIGALRMASEMMRPAAVDFLDTMLRTEKGNLRIHDLAISRKSSVIGKKISDSGLQDKYNLLILGARHETEEIEFNPPPSSVLKEGMTLVVMGDIKKINSAKEIL